MTQTSLDLDAGENDRDTEFERLMDDWHRADRLLVDGELNRCRLDRDRARARVTIRTQAARRRDRDNQTS